MEPIDCKCVISSSTIGTCIILWSMHEGLQLVVQWMCLKWGIPHVVKHCWVAMLTFIFLLSNHGHSQVLTLNNNLENERSSDVSLTKNSKGSCRPHHLHIGV